MAQLVLKNIDAETAEKLEMRAKRLGTTPEEEAAQLLRERLRGEPHREPATTSAAAVKTPAIVTTANAIPPELASKLAGLQDELGKLREESSKKMRDEQEIQHSGADDRFIRKHGFLVFVGAVKSEEIPLTLQIYREALDRSSSKGLRGVGQVFTLISWGGLGGEASVAVWPKATRRSASVAPHREQNSSRSALVRARSERSNHRVRSHSSHVQITAFV